MYIPIINFLKFYVIWEVGGKVGGPRPFFVPEFTLVFELFEHNFVEVSPYIEGGR